MRTFPSSPIVTFVFANDLLDGSLDLIARQHGGQGGREGETCFSHQSRAAFGVLPAPIDMPAARRRFSISFVAWSVPRQCQRPSKSRMPRGRSGILHLTVRERGIFQLVRQDGLGPDRLGGGLHAGEVLRVDLDGGPPMPAGAAAAQALGRELGRAMIDAEALSHAAD
jgi:hypothetical protein